MDDATSTQPAGREGPLSKAAERAYERDIARLTRGLAHVEAWSASAESPPDPDLSPLDSRCPDPATRLRDPDRLPIRMSRRFRSVLNHANRSTLDACIENPRFTHRLED